MTQQEKISAVATAMASQRGQGAPNPNDMDFATKLVIAWERMKLIDTAAFAETVMQKQQE